MSALLGQEMLPKMPAGINPPFAVPGKLRHCRCLFLPPFLLYVALLQSWNLRSPQTTRILGAQLGRARMLLGHADSAPHIPGSHAGVHALTH